VVDKLLNGLKDLDASEVPPFMYQMLRLCGNQYFLLVLMHAQKYFKKSAGPSGANQDADSIETVMTDSNKNNSYNFKC
jgi:FANCI solenoid 1